ncbi:MAG: NADH:flavin oxidoreductase [Treponema sp.]|nr:NADH:flavin oxidoreductase [Treponema sp.]
MKLFDPINIGQKTSANRIMMPPCVVFGAATRNGEIGEFRLNHYSQRAKDGVGTIVIEASAIDENYTICPDQVGIWSDAQIPGLKELARQIHQYESLCMVQIHHAGANISTAAREEIPIGPSNGELRRPMREASVAELEEICAMYIAAAQRAQEAGFDGVEIHGAHNYLLTQMASPLLNKRTDAYGGTLEKRLKLAIDVLQGIRAKCGEAFIVGIRMGANEPTYDEGIAIAGLYEQNGADYLSVSSGFGEASSLPPPPEDFPYNNTVYGGALVKKHSQGVPVILVNNILTAQRGEWLLQNGHGDMVAYGKPILATPDFVSRAKTSPDNNNDCLGCRPCVWFSNFTKCPLVGA